MLAAFNARMRGRGGGGGGKAARGGGGGDGSGGEQLAATAAPAARRGRGQGARSGGVGATTSAGDGAGGNDHAVVVSAHAHLAGALLDEARGLARSLAARGWARGGGAEPLPGGAAAGAPPAPAPPGAVGGDGGTHSGIGDGRGGGAPLTLGEKRALSDACWRLDAEHTRGALALVTPGGGDGGNLHRIGGGGEVVVDLDALALGAVRELQVPRAHGDMHFVCGHMHIRMHLSALQVCPRARPVVSIRHSHSRMRE